ncbi:MAG: nucleotide exchange factor GrpE [Thiotrichales bacterium]
MQGEDKNLPMNEDANPDDLEAVDDTIEMRQPAADHEQLKRELDDVQTKMNDYWERILRQQAEMDNLRKRAERDVDNARRYALERFAADLLAVCDSLELGLAASQVDAGTDKLREGMELTLKMLLDALERHGIRPVNAHGERFNPELHQAMTTQERGDCEANTVIAVMQKGYLLNDRLLRPAMVIVSKPPTMG